MSWDIFIQDIPADARTVRDIPEDFSPAPLGKRADLIRRIKQIAPTAEFSDPAWGRLDAPTFSVEFNIGEQEIVDGIALHVRGDDAAAAFVTELLSHLGFRAFDGQTDSGLFQPAQAVASLRRWREYRDQVIE